MSTPAAACSPLSWQCPWRPLRLLPSHGHMMIAATANGCAGASRTVAAGSARPAANGVKKCGTKSGNALPGSVATGADRKPSGIVSCLGARSGMALAE